MLPSALLQLSCLWLHGGQIVVLLPALHVQCVTANAVV